MDGYFFDLPYSINATGGFHSTSNAESQTAHDENNPIHCVSKNNTDVAHYNFNPHQPISVVFGRDVAERVQYRTVICYPTSPS